MEGNAPSYLVLTETPFGDLGITMPTVIEEDGQQVRITAEPTGRIRARQNLSAKRTNLQEKARRIGGEGTGGFFTGIGGVLDVTQEDLQRRIEEAREIEREIEEVERQMETPDVRPFEGTKAFDAEWAAQLEEYIRNEIEIIENPAHPISAQTARTRLRRWQAELDAMRAPNE
jgi:hypothetical protein